MAASDAITVEATARTLIERGTAHTADPALATADIDMLLTMAASDDGEGGTHYTVSDLNRVVSLGWNWKAGTASASFEAGVGSGKTFKLQQQYEHCRQMEAGYANGSLSVVGSADVSDGTSTRRTSGSIQLSTVLTETDA